MDINIPNENDKPLYISYSYLRETFLKNYKLNLFIIFITIAYSFYEIYYRNILYKYSFDLEKSIQENISNSISIVSYLTKIGGKEFIRLIISIMFLFFPIVKAMFFIVGIYLNIEINFIMKLWYADLRPFMEENSLYQGKCETSYGNPSGHSTLVTYIFLLLFVYIKDINFIKENILIKYFILGTFIKLIFSVISSRVILGVHSINQVIYGSLLGFDMFFIFAYMFKLDKMPVSYYKKFFKKRSYIITILFFIIIIIAIIFINQFIISKNINIDFVQYNTIINALCKKDVPEYKRFNYDVIFGSLLIFSILGGYLGQIFFWYLIDKLYKNKDININKKDVFDFSESIKKNNGIEFKDLGIDDEENSSIGVNNKENEDSNTENDNVKNYEEENLLIDELINNWPENRKLFSSITNILATLLIVVLCHAGSIFIPSEPDMNDIILSQIMISFKNFSSSFLFNSAGLYLIITITCGPYETLLEKLNKSQNKKIKIFK